MNQGTAILIGFLAGVVLADKVKEILQGNQTATTPMPVMRKQGYTTAPSSASMVAGYYYPRPYLAVTSRAMNLGY